MQKRFIGILSLQARDALQIWGENIKLARKTRKVTQQEIADRAAMDIKTYRNIELGSPTISVGAYLAIMDILDLLDGIESLCAPHKDEHGRQIRNRRGS
jgi:transcriptional regulator with XRE-family HTH domain